MTRLNSSPFLSSVRPHAPLNRADALARQRSRRGNPSHILDGMRSGKQRATAADDLDETMTARHDSSLDNVEHSSSLSRRAITPQYADALMCSHELTVANALLPSKEAGDNAPRRRMISTRR